MIFKLIQEDNGDYTDGLLNYSLLIGENFIDSPEGLNVNCVFHDTVEEAENYYGIRKRELA